MFKIHEGVGRPQSPSYLLAGNHFPRFLQQDGKDAKRLAWQPDAHSVLPQFPRGKVYLEDAKAEDTPWRERLRFRHSLTTPRNGPPLRVAVTNVLNDNPI